MAFAPACTHIFVEVADVTYENQPTITCEFLLGIRAKWKFRHALLKTLFREGVRFLAYVSEIKDISDEVC